MERIKTTTKTMANTSRSNRRFQQHSEGVHGLEETPKCIDRHGDKYIEHIFKMVGGKWTCLDMKVPMTLADYLTLQDLCIDEKITFARIRYAENVEIRYRVDGGKVSILIHQWK